MKIQPAAYSFGRCFEHFLIAEIYRLNEYFETHYKLSYLRSKDGLEIDLILQRGREHTLIEIKSKKQILSEDLKHLKAVKKNMPSAKSLLLSRDKVKRREDGILIVPWQEGLKTLFGKSESPSSAEA